MVADSSIVSTDGQWRWDGVQWVAQEVAAPSYRVGDVVNGHILRSDERHPLTRTRATWIDEANAVTKLAWTQSNPGSAFGLAHPTFLDQRRDHCAHRANRLCCNPLNLHTVAISR